MFAFFLHVTPAICLLLVTLYHLLRVIIYLFLNKCLYLYLFMIICSLAIAQPSLSLSIVTESRVAGPGLQRSPEEGFPQRCDALRHAASGGLQLAVVRD